MLSPSCSTAEPVRAASGRADRASDPRRERGIHSRASGHNDLAPWNLIIGDRWVFIDWDGAGPSSRVWDLAYAAQAFTLSDASEVPEVAATRLAALIDGYGADQNLRQQLPGTMVLRARAMYELLHSSHRSGREPWASMFASGHGRHWHTATEYVERHQQVWSRALLSHAC